MSSQLSVGKDDVMGDAIFCPQCKQKYGPTGSKREAKLLSCLDTFCSDCLHKHIADVTENYPWSTVSCQLCLTPIDDAVEALKTNPVVEVLLRIEAITSDPDAGHRSDCDACAGEILEGRVDGRAPRAECYCEECDQKMCAQCHSAHGKLRSTKSHRKVVLLGSQDSKALARSWKELLPPCSFHGENSAGEFHCSPCRAFICRVCTQEHDVKHTRLTNPCRPSRQVIQELRVAIAERAGEVAILGNESKALQDTIKQKKALFADSVNATSKEIVDRVKSMHLTIETHKNELLARLEKIRVETEEVFEETLDSARRNELRVNGFVRFADLMETVDLTTLDLLSPMVHQRAAYLTRTTQSDSDSGDLVSVNLAPGPWHQIVTTIAPANCIGSIDVRKSSPSPQT